MPEFGYPIDRQDAPRNAGPDAYPMRSIRGHFAKGGAALIKPRATKDALAAVAASPVISSATREPSQPSFSALVQQARTQGCVSAPPPLEMRPWWKCLVGRGVSLERE
jgi:hypothetical protein